MTKTISKNKKGKILAKKTVGKNNNGKRYGKKNRTNRKMKGGVIKTFRKLLSRCMGKNCAKVAVNIEDPTEFEISNTLGTDSVDTTYMDEKKLWPIDNWFYYSGEYKTEEGKQFINYGNYNVTIYRFAQITNNIDLQHINYLVDNKSKNTFYAYGIINGYLNKNMVWISQKCDKISNKIKYLFHIYNYEESYAISVKEMFDKMPVMKYERIFNESMNASVITLSNVDGNIYFKIVIEEIRNPEHEIYYSDEYNTKKSFIDIFEEIYNNYKENAEKDEDDNFKYPQIYI